MEKAENRIIYADVLPLTDDKAFGDELSEVSKYRKDKVNRLIGEDKKRQSLLCGILLKECLHRIGIDEKTAEYSSGLNGKPSLKEYPQVKFGVSHSGRYAVCVLSDNEIGCDVQEVKPTDFKIAEKFFSDDERKLLGRVSEDEKTDVFFSIWARKESFVKACGENLVSFFNRFSVCDEKGFLSAVRYDGKEWFIREYDALYGYKLAVCTLSERFDGEPTEYLFSTSINNKN